MRLILEGSPEEFAALIKDLSKGNSLSQKTVDLLSAIKTEVPPIKHMPVGDIWDDFTWPAIHLFDVIRVHHSEETEDYYSMTMTELIENYFGKSESKSLQISRIVGGARQTTNKYSCQPLLKIHKTGNDKIVRASKKFLDGFYHNMINWRTIYTQNLEERGFSVPGDERSYDSPTK